VWLRFLARCLKIQEHWKQPVHFLGTSIDITDALSCPKSSVPRTEHLTGVLYLKWFYLQTGPSCILLPACGKLCISDFIMANKDTVGCLHDKKTVAFNTMLSSIDAIWNIRTILTNITWSFVLMVLEVKLAS